MRRYDNNFVKNCPKCGGEMFYANKYLLQRAIDRSTVCNKGYCKPPINGWVKKCSNCNGEMKYPQKWHLDQSIKNNTKCRKCCNIGRKASEECKRKISESSVGKIMSDESRNKMRKNSSRYWKGKCGIDNPNSGKIRTNEMKLKMSISKLGERNNNFGRRFSEDVKRKHRRAVMERLNRLGIPSREDIGARKYFSKVNQKGFDFRPTRFVEIGYEADGYDKNKHIWCEFDTPHHRRVGKRTKDQVRQKNIIEYFEKIGTPLTSFIRVEANEEGEVLNSKCVYGNSKEDVYASV